MYTFTYNHIWSYVRCTYIFIFDYICGVQTHFYIHLYTYISCISFYVLHFFRQMWARDAAFIETKILPYYTSFSQCVYIYIHIYTYFVYSVLIHTYIFTHLFVYLGFLFVHIILISRTHSVEDVKTSSCRTIAPQCLHAYLCIYLRIYSAYKSVYIYIPMHKYVYIFRVYMHIYAYTCLCIMYLCFYIILTLRTCAYIYICVHMYIYICTHVYVPTFLFCIYTSLYQNLYTFVDIFCVYIHTYTYFCL